MWVCATASLIKDTLPLAFERNLVQFTLFFSMVLHNTAKDAFNWLTNKKV